MVTVHDIMTLDVLTTTPQATLREAAEELAAEHVGGLPVVDGSEVVGVISATDILDFAANAPGRPVERERATGFESFPTGELWEEEGEPPSRYFVELWEEPRSGLGQELESFGRPEWNVLEEHQVAELMTRTLVALPPETDVREAAEYMLRNQVHRVLVVDDGELVGMVTTMDVVKAVSQHGLGG